MNIKMVLLASAAAFAASTPVLAADAIVAAEPEPVEYVRVCDAYGTGYFYIPGTETCLKIEGYIRFQVNVGPTSDTNDSSWDAVTRGQVQFTAKSDTEYGPLTGVIVLQANADNATNQDTILDSAYLDVAGFRAGLFYSWWDDGLSGETDDIGSVVTLHNSIRYQYETGSFYAGISVDELEDGVYQGDFDPALDALVANDGPNNVGVAFGIGGTAGAFSYQITGGWDFDNEDGAIRAMGTAELGPGTLGLAVVYSSGPNSYYSTAEWAVAAEYAIKATDKLKITPGVQYYGNYIGGADPFATVPDSFDGAGDAWKAGLTVDYQIVDNFYAKASVQYLDPEDGDDVTTGYFRLQRSF
ncbi:porin [Rhizobium viscosum]|uniref:Porin n=3 Tax=Rhizobium viscosum TaxID=1673 RepID=A0ABR9J1K4_RHIVS|nr:porin [Rhizobium viscosum]MBE1509359.1 hypothetical protein [Rhizobium viscosum]